MDDAVNDTQKTPKDITAEVYLARLAERGIEYVFANAGTDFAPIVESLSRNAGSNRFPKFLTVLHEFVKWDYELRDGQPVDAVVDRALDIAMSEPRGPVYLTLPREVLANPATRARRGNVRPLGAVTPEPAQAAIEEAAALIAKAD